MSRLQFDVHNALAAWQWGPFSVAVAIVLVGTAYWYLRADWLLASRGRRWPARRTIPFMAGLLAVDFALQSPVATFTGSYFEAHVLQHLLLMAVAPPLLALGAPSTLLLQTGSRGTKKRWLAVLRSRPFASVSHPVVVWFLYFGVMFAFFLTPLLNFAMEHMALMDAINVGFLFGGTLYWWPMVGLDPIVHWKMGYGARIANLAVGVPFEAFLGIAIMYQKQPVASMYTLSSTHSGGALLWAATELSTFFGLIPVFVQWQRADQRAGARADERAARAARPIGALSPGLAGTSELDVQLQASAPVRATAFGQQFKPLLQPGNSSWEAMWKAKAGFVPSSRGAKPNSPPLRTSRPKD
jgi:cytochrome c oxidase assembly factor CtaG